MPEMLLPLFPLGLVLLPGAPQALHIFEERYKEMIGEAVANGTEFGIVQAEENRMMSVGCSAVVDRVVNRYEDGRLDILAIGRRRFEVIQLDREKSYLRGSVTFFDDEDEVPAGHDKQALALAGLQALLESEGQEFTIGDSADTRYLSFLIGRFVDDANLKQTLLVLRSETERLDFLISFFPDYIARRKRIAHARKVGPLNGHATK